MCVRVFFLKRVLLLLFFTPSPILKTIVIFRAYRGEYLFPTPVVHPSLCQQSSAASWSGNKGEGRREIPDLSATWVLPHHVDFPFRVLLLSWRSFFRAILTIT